MSLDLLLLFAALICFLLAAFSANTGRVQLVPLGLALCVLTAITPAATL